LYIINKGNARQSIKPKTYIFFGWSSSKLFLVKHFSFGEMFAKPKAMHGLLYKNSFFAIGIINNIDDNLDQIAFI
jgi:hypothetical protein